MPDLDLSKVTPMMQKYLETKKEYPDCILFYRLGDFYEMFFEDAQIVSKELELTLTGKSCGLEERAPMCGIPYHAVDSYLPRLVAHGHKVAICEQVENPKEAKGLVKREVIQVVTPGTNTNLQALDANRNNYLCSIYYSSKKIGFSIIDITTGDYYVTELDSCRQIKDEIMKFEPAEIICNREYVENQSEIKELTDRLSIPVNILDASVFSFDICQQKLQNKFHVSSLLGLGIADYPQGICAAGALLSYLSETQMTELSHITHINPYSPDKYMLLDSSTRRNLELTETLREKAKTGSLLWVLDKTKTAMGGRYLRASLEQPFIDPVSINLRLDAIEALNAKPMSRDEIRDYLNPVYDLERLFSKIAFKTANPRDLLAFGNSLSYMPSIKIVLEEYSSAELDDINQMIDSLTDITTLIKASIREDAPISIREGEIIRDGYHAEVDRLRSAGREGKNWLSDLEQSEAQRTGIKNLHIKYHKAFGYFFEVTNSYKDMVPEDFIRRQTLTNAERFTTVKLKELEDTILNAQDKLAGLEYDLFCEIRDKIGEAIDRIQSTAKGIAMLDMDTSLAYVSEKNRYVRPALNTDGIIDIKNGRHPVVEKMISADQFIANDTYLDTKTNLVSIITGPNMAGKSTYMRQSALICLMAQMGCFVPAEYANIGIADRIFTRVGASDDLASGQSTFMVEMNEVSNILRNATANSLLILDEIGRGTSTYDGLSIAWAVIEHISNPNILGARTLFATHYHELTELEGRIKNVNNYCIAVKESGDDIVFLRQIIKGGADKSYGIQVARLAGVPDMVIDRAKEIAEKLSNNDITMKLQDLSQISVPKAKNKKAKKPDEVDLGQISFFDSISDEDIIRELLEVDVTRITPLDALNALYRIQNKAKNRYQI